MRKLEWLNILNSPFKRPRLKFYLGKLAHGVPYFYPRRWVKSKKKEGYLEPIPKKIGFDLVGLGWKTKWDDYRFEWSPMFSFVFFKWQFCIFALGPGSRKDNYWEAWLYYHYRTSGNKMKRLLKTMEDNSLTYKWSKAYGKESGYECDWPYILKDKYVHLGEEKKQEYLEKVKKEEL